MTQSHDEKLAALEALLFIHGEPMTQKKIAKVLEIETKEAEALLEELKTKLALADRGLTLVSEGDLFQLATKPQFHAIAEEFVKSELSEELSPASLETLAIVAYCGPISRNKIDYQRGVNSSFILRSLLLRGLIERAPDPEHPNSYLYSPSIAFVKHLGISKKEDLPEYEKFKKIQDFSAPDVPSVSEAQPENLDQ